MLDGVFGEAARVISCRLALLASVALAGLTACNGTLPPAPPHALVAPAPAQAPIQACWLEYGTATFPGTYGLAGASDDYHWDVTFSGILLRHPKGDLLLDVGKSTHFSDEVEDQHFLSRQLLKNIQGGGDWRLSVVQALQTVNENPASVKGILLSHIHGDHAGGMMDMPTTPVLLSQTELDFAKAERDKGGFDVVHAHALAVEQRGKGLKIDGPAYENFDSSLDYYGDGSIVIVPMPGHTPGSIGVFVNRSPSERYFHVGDASNTLEAVYKRRGKSVVLEFTDHDGGQADGMVAKLNQLHAQDASVQILPAHDRKAWIRIFGAPSACR